MLLQSYWKKRGERGEEREEKTQKEERKKDEIFFFFFFFLQHYTIFFYLSANLVEEKVFFYFNNMLKHNSFSHYTIFFFHPGWKKTKTAFFVCFVKEKRKKVNPWLLTCPDRGLQNWKNKNKNKRIKLKRKQMLTKWGSVYLQNDKGTRCCEDSSRGEVQILRSAEEAETTRGKKIE